MLLRIITILCAIITVIRSQAHSIPRYSVDFCNDNKDIFAVINLANSRAYYVIINKSLTSGTTMRVKLDSGGAISFAEFGREYPDSARFTGDNDLVNNVYNFILLKNTTVFNLEIRGRYRPEHPPYIISLKINGEENCKEPDRTFFGRFYSQTDIHPFWPDAPDKFCGRQRINRDYTELIVSGSGSKVGEWPWHTAIYRLKRGTLNYICGGTLISKLSVLTAAHCATVNGAALNPDTMGVVLGRYRLIGNEGTTQDKAVHQVIVHDEFEPKTLNNDIAILKLGTEAVFNNYVQPACIWLDAAYNQMDSYEIQGKVVGWGIDQNEMLSSKLKEATMPIMPDIVCIRHDPIFYSNILNGKKFCAGYGNGTSACNGDSGGGLVVLIQDLKNPLYPSDKKPGAWYVKGIVSVSLTRTVDSVCDPNSYTVFTDVAKYRDWILEKM